jgi:hypothetical protein
MGSLRSVPSRRDVLRGLAATGVGLSLAAFPSLAEAAPTPRKKRKRPTPAKPNRFGCLEVTDPCRRHTQCCSGICTGKPGRKRCRAHGTGSCSQQGIGVCTAPNPALHRCNGNPNCFCFHTTAGSNFCGSFLGGDGCAVCTRDIDCLTLGFPAGSACVPVANGHCTEAACASAMACVPPCGFEPPPEM